MKTKLYLLFMVFTGISCFVACKKMDGTYSQYIVKGGIQYPGAAKTAVVRSGNKRAELVWVNSSDPKVIGAKVYWNNFRDSVTIPITANMDTIRYTFSNLAENFYSFTIRTYDASGNKSVPVEVSGNVYGDSYQARILERPVSAAFLKTSDALSITWNDADTVTGAIKTEVEYTSTSGAVKTTIFPARQIVTEIADYQQGTTFKYRTIYRPDSLSIDDFYTGYITQTEISIDKKDWSLIAYSDQYSSGNEAAKNMIDGTPYTRWHTNGSDYPHSITVDMGVVRTIKRFSTLNSLYDGPGGDNRAPIKIQFLVSRDNVTWTSLGVFSSDNEMIAEQFYEMPAGATGRYFKLVGLEGPDGNSQFMVLGEVSAYIF